MTRKSLLKKLCVFYVSEIKESLIRIFFLIHFLKKLACIYMSSPTMYYIYLIMTKNNLVKIFFIKMRKSIIKMNNLQIDFILIGNRTYCEN